MNKMTITMMQKGITTWFPSISYAKECALQFVRRTDRNATIEWKLENNYICGYTATDVPDVPTFIIMGEENV